MSADSTFYIRLFGPFCLRFPGKSWQGTNPEAKMRLLARLCAEPGANFLSYSDLAAELGFAVNSNGDSTRGLRDTLRSLRILLGEASARIEHPDGEGSKGLCRLNTSGWYVDTRRFDRFIASDNPASALRALRLYRAPLLYGWLPTDLPGGASPSVPEARWTQWIAAARMERQKRVESALADLDFSRLPDTEFGRMGAVLRRLVFHDAQFEPALRRWLRFLAEERLFARAERDFLKCKRLLRRHPEFTSLQPETLRAYSMIRQESAYFEQLSPTGRVPAPADLFVPRPLLEAQIRHACRRHRLVTIRGCAGAGKTRLALAVAARLRPDYRNRACFVDLSGEKEGSGVAFKVTAALNVPLAPGQSPQEALHVWLQPRHLLLVLDNCEHLRAAVRRLARDLLAHCPHLNILVTSRTPLGLPDEQEIEVAPLPMPPEEARSLQELKQYAASRLFLERLPNAVFSFPQSIGDTDAPAIAAICRALDGLPLAIELAAARMRTLTLQQVREGLENKQALLIGGPTLFRQRHRTLQFALELSCNLLSGRASALFSRLSVFAGGWTREAALAVCGDENNAAGTTEALQELSLHSLLTPCQEPQDRSRQRMLAAIHDFAARRLTPEEATVSQRRHCRYFARWAEAGAQRFGDNEETDWLQRLDAERGNLNMALAFALSEQGDVQEGLRLGAALWRYWRIRGWVGEGYDWLLRILNASAELPATPLRASVLTGAGVLATYLNRLEEARALAEQGLTTARAVHSKAEEARALWCLGITAMRRIQNPRAPESRELFTRAEQFHAQALALRREYGTPCDISSSLHSLARVYAEQERLEEALPLYESSLRAAPEGDVARAVTHNNLAQLYISREEFLLAHKHVKEALRLYEETNNAIGLAMLFMTLGRLAHEQEQHRCSVVIYAAGMRQHDRLSLPLPSSFEQDFEMRKLKLREAVRDEFPSAWAEGHLMTVTDTLAYVRANLFRNVCFEGVPAHCPASK